MRIEGRRLQVAATKTTERPRHQRAVSFARKEAKLKNLALGVTTT
jgi:hypothetical protein